MQGTKQGLSNQGAELLNNDQQHVPTLVWCAVLVAALGYFVDVFDLWLFANLRITSLSSLGLTSEEITVIGAEVINYQQIGLLVGGFLWGVLADKKGRASVMFGSILLYSVANLLNGYVTTVLEYKVLRFIAGVGLAGEIGTGITLISELLPRSKRGIGVTIVTTLGVSGACFAAIAAKYLDWRSAYIVGGLMGLALLLLRFLVHESGLFKTMQAAEGVKRGSIRLLFSDKERALRFMSCICIGIPIYLTFGIFATFAPEISTLSGFGEVVSVSDAILVSAVTMTVGDLLAGLLSQRLESRRVPISILLGIGFIAALLLSTGIFKSPTAYLIFVGVTGTCSGYWACLLATAAEQFGTNLRATATTALPNIVRATTVLLNSSFIYLKSGTNITTLLIMTLTVYALAFLGVYRVRETFHSDLNFVER